GRPLWVQQCGDSLCNQISEQSPDQCREDSILWLRRAREQFSLTPLILFPLLPLTNSLFLFVSQALHVTDDHAEGLQFQADPCGRGRPGLYAAGDLLPEFAQRPLPYLLQRRKGDSFSTRDALGTRPLVLEFKPRFRRGGRFEGMPAKRSAMATGG